jgi:two-component system, chemotaxis family, chemotaxis protein CheY
MAAILVIDDDPMAREIITEMLSQNGHRAVNASDGGEGLELFKNGAFDLVITDMIMPEVEGVETIIQLRKDNPDVKIIAISGGGRISAYSHLSIAEKFGVMKTLTKPFAKDDLLKAVDELLKL